MRFLIVPLSLALLCSTAGYGQRINLGTLQEKNNPKSGSPSAPARTASPSQGEQRSGNIIFRRGGQQPAAGTPDAPAAPKESLRPIEQRRTEEPRRSEEPRRIEEPRRTEEPRSTQRTSEPASGDSRININTSGAKGAAEGTGAQAGAQAFGRNGSAPGSFTLEQCVNYALANNLTIQQSVLNARLARLRLKQSELALLPNVNANGNYGRSFGRSIDPTTNQFIDAGYQFVSAGASADFLIFGWFQKRNIIKQNDFSYQASRYDQDQSQNDVSLNVATGFLRSVQAKEQITISQNQVSLSRAQLEQTREFLKAGRVPELNVAQLESQLANDSANLITAIANHTATLLDLRALLNMEFDTPFELTTPNVSTIENLSLTAMTPEDVYDEAARNLGVIKASSLRVDAARSSYKAALGAKYPQLTINFQSGTNYSSIYRQVTGYSDGGYQASGSVISVNGQTYNVYQPVIVPTVVNTPLSDQLSQNFRQTLSLGLVVPLFNSWQAQFNARSARIAIQSRIIDLKQSELTLKQNVYRAYNDARNSIQKYIAARRAMESATRALDFAKKRYDLGLTNTVEYLTIQNTKYNADANLVTAKYDAIFRLKVIDYYLGKPLKL